MTRPPLTKQRSTTALVLATHRTRAHSQVGSRPEVTKLEHDSTRSRSQTQRKDHTLDGLNATASPPAPQRAANLWEASSGSCSHELCVQYRRQEGGRWHWYARQCGGQIAH